MKWLNAKQLNFVLDMFEQVESQKVSKSTSVADSVTQKKSDGKPGFGLIDNRPQDIAQRDLIQRVSIVIGYTGNDSTKDTMYEKSLNHLPAPNPIYTFTNEGEENPSGAAKALIAKHAEKGTDKSTLHLIAHGSPSWMGNLDKLFGNQQQPGLLDSHMSPDINRVHLYACYAMMKQDGVSSSAAHRVSLWIQKHLAHTPQQSVALRTGYSSNNVTEYAKGLPSFEPLNLRHTLKAHQLDHYLLYAARAELRTKGISKEALPSEDIFREIDDEAVINKIVAKAHASPSAPREHTTSRADRGKVPAKEFLVTSSSFQGDKELERGYATLNVTSENYQKFPERLIMREGLEDVSGEVLTILADYVKDIVKIFEEEAKPPQFGFTGFAAPQGASTGLGNTSPQFGFGNTTPQFGFGNTSPQGVSMGSGINHDPARLQ